jgi:hypothetical protein
MPNAASTETRPASPAIEKIKVKVDGREVEVPKAMPDPLTGRPIPTTMIQACALARVEVPGALSRASSICLSNRRM